MAQNNVRVLGIEGAMGSMNVRGGAVGLAGLNVNAVEFVPRLGGGPPEPAAAPTSSGYQLDMCAPVDSTGFVPPAPRSESDVRLLKEVEVGVEQLIGEPENFETWSEAIGDCLAAQHVDQYAVELVGNLFFDMAANLFHVSYHVVKLFKFVREYIPREKGVWLKNSLLTRCRHEHERRQFLAGTSPDLFRNVSLFMGELYLLPLAGQSRLGVLREALVDYLGCLLDVAGSPDPGNYEENLKCAVRILKCCGSALETDDKGKVDALFETLDRFCAAVPLTDSSKSVVASLRDLRAMGWGLLNENGAQQEAEEPLSAGLFVGPDGLPLSKEEIAFLEENLAANESTDTEEFEQEKR